MRAAVDSRGNRSPADNWALPTETDAAQPPPSTWEHGPYSNGCTYGPSVRRTFYALSLTILPPRTQNLRRFVKTTSVVLRVAHRGRRGAHRAVTWDAFFGWIVKGISATAFACALIVPTVDYEEMFRARCKRAMVADPDQWADLTATRSTLANICPLRCAWHWIAVNSSRHQPIIRGLPISAPRPCCAGNT